MPRPYRLRYAKAHKGILVSSPHSGRYYPKAFLRQSQLDETKIRASEDAFVDKIFAHAPQTGADLLTAIYPRAYVDLNRAPNELDPKMFATPLPENVITDSPRVRAGLGTIARQVGEQASIYRDLLTYKDVKARIGKLYAPFHRQLRQRLDRLCATHGQVLLLDTHSMPSTTKYKKRPPSLSTLTGRDSLKSTRQPDFVLGNRFGRSCHNNITHFITKQLQQQGYRISHNQPYAGGYITEHYADPQAGIHTIQIEINRALYMDEQSLALHSGFEKLQNDITALLHALGEKWQTLVPQSTQRSALRAAE